MNIAVFGTGYVGLVTGTCFAEMGNNVFCVDVDAKKIEGLKNGVSPIYEPGLDELIHSNQHSGRLRFTTNSEEAIRTSDILFIAVGTPPGEDGSADLKYVLQVANTIGQHLEKPSVIVNKSTVPVGTSKMVTTVIKNQLSDRQVHLDFEVVSNPEFLKEGTAVADCLKPARIVVGAQSEFGIKVMKRLYDPFVKNGHPLIFMDQTSSEMTKYAANAMLATKISFMNELSELCERVGADVELVRNGIGSDPRIGYSFIYPGLGYGGSCFPKDVQALAKTGISHDVNLTIIKAVEAANKRQRSRFANQVLTKAKSLQVKKIALWGLAFKPGTDDVREAPALDLITGFLDAGLDVSAYDPVATETTKVALGTLSSKVQLCLDQYEALDGADMLVIATEWASFKEPDFGRIKNKLSKFVIADGRNLYSPRLMEELGAQYLSIGRAKVGW